MSVVMMPVHVLKCLGEGVVLLTIVIQLHRFIELLLQLCAGLAVQSPFNFLALQPSDACAGAVPAVLCRRWDPHPVLRCQAKRQEQPHHIDRRA